MTRPLLIEERSFGPQQLLTLAQHCPAEFPLLLDSAGGGPLDRWTLLLAAEGEWLELAADGLLSGARGGTDFLAALDALSVAAAAASTGPVIDALPFRGGWILYVGYELAAQIEPGLGLPPARSGQPVAAALRAPAALLYEHRSGKGYVVAEARAASLLAHLLRRLEALHASDGGLPGRLQWPETDRSPPARADWLERLVEDPPERYLEGVQRSLEYIRLGDVYQVNLSRGWRTPLPASSHVALAGSLYGALRSANPAPFAALLQLPDYAVLSSSPERLVRVADGSVETRPIAGTRRRSRLLGADAGEMAALRANAKEQAEHVMLIDLERNDLGRICVAGSVEINEFMVTESYQHVHHLVSNVRGRLRPDVTPGGVLRALFPGGTITGCPKYRCMQIIGELEAAPRGAYTGSLGYLNHDGSMDLNILIRSLVLAGDELSFRTGAGVVADSDPERELAETRAKAEGLLRALRVAQ